MVIGWRSRKWLFSIILAGCALLAHAQGSVTDNQEDSLEAILEAIELDGFPSGEFGNVDGFDDESTTVSLTRDSIITLAKSLIGAPYKFGGVTPDGFDCSGFVQFVFDEIDIDLPHSSGAMAVMGKEVSQEELQPGDLLFFKGSNKKSNNVGHVGIVVAILNGNSVKMVHAATHGGIRADYPFAQPYYNDRFIKAMRLVQ